jgi:hypothetical protein
MTLMYRRLRVSTLILLSSLTLSASAETLGSYKDWAAQTFKMDGQPVCSLWSAPQSAEGKYSKRGEIFVWVTHRPSDQALHRVSFEMGYPIKSGSRIKVTIDKELYELLADGSTAFNIASKADLKMVKAMRAAKEMEVRGVSKRGTATLDKYSLLGFTAAHNAIGKACKVRN